MDSIFGDDVTLPVDMNGSCGPPHSMDGETLEGDLSADSMTALSFPAKLSPSKALTMKDYENQITALKKENFNLKLRIYFMEERMQQKCDSSTEDIFRTNIELKVELESMKRDLAEKQDLLVSASKALESLAARDSGEPNRFREQAQREMDALREVFNTRISDLEQVLQAANDEVEKMAAIAEQEKLKNINMKKELQVMHLPGSIHQDPTLDLQLALQEKDNFIEQLKITLKNQEALVREQGKETQSLAGVPQLSELIAKKDHELEELRETLRERDTVRPETQKQTDFHHLEMVNKLLDEELIQTKRTIEDLKKTLDETQKSLSGKLEEKENELNSEKKNALKRDKMIQGLTQVLKEKEKEMAELCHEIEDRDDALTKTRESVHKAQLQKYQGVEEHQNLLMAKQTELAQLQNNHHSKMLEAQKLQRTLDRREEELADMQKAKEQLEVELEDMQQQKKKGDKALNDLNNQLKKMSGEIRERETSLELQYQEVLDQTKRKLQAHEVTIQRLISNLAEKEQQLQEYINMVRDFEQNKSPAGNNMLSKLRQRLKEKEKALEQALDDRFAVIEEKDNEIHQLQLSLRERERDLERLNNILSHNEETINSFDSTIKEKDVEIQHLANTLKNLQRAKHDLEENLNRALREKDSIISQLQQSLNGKTKDLEELSVSMLSQTQSQTDYLAEQMGQRLKVTEAMLSEAVKARERLVSDNESAVEGLLATISSKDQLLKESAEHYNRMLSKRSLEIQDLRRQLSERQQQLFTAGKQNSTNAQEGCLETAALKAMLEEKDSLINKLLQRGEERDQYLAEVKQRGELEDVLELRKTLQIMQERLEHSEAELFRWTSGEQVRNVSFHNKTVVLLKTELEQKAEELNNFLKREGELKKSLTELQSLLSQLEGQGQAYAADVKSLTATLKTKDEIIDDLTQRLGQQGDYELQQRVHGSSVGASLPSVTQRENSTISADQSNALAPIVDFQQEHTTLHKALRAEQHLYSNLVRAVKEQDSVQRLHALQLELTAVQLLRQQLEESIKANEVLRNDMEREITRVREDLKELEGMRHQLEDAHRWNTSLQARLGAMQNHSGGVGGANDAGDTSSPIGDQTSYMSICLGDDQDDSLSLLSAQELQKMVLELKQKIKRLEALNNDNQNSWTHGSRSSFLKEQLEQTRQDTLVPRTSHQRNKLDQNLSGKVLTNESLDSGLSHSREHVHSGSNTVHTGESWPMINSLELDSLKADLGVESLLQLREEMQKLRSEKMALQGLLKEQNSTERKEESTDMSANSSDGRTEWKQSGEMLQSQAAVGGQKTSNARSEKRTNTKKKPQDKKCLQAKLQSVAKKATKSRSELKSGLPIPVRLRALDQCSDQSRDECPSVSSVEFDHGSDTTEGQCSFNQLGLLLQECQEKDSVIHELREQLRENEDLSCRFTEELQAQKNTIAYLTACSLDSQNGLALHAGVSDASLHNKCEDLHKALQEKDELIARNSVLLSMAKQALSTLDLEESHPEMRELCSKLEMELEKGASFNQKSREVSEDALTELPVQSTKNLQAELFGQNRQDAELQERLRPHEAAQHGETGGGQSLSQTELGDRNKGKDQIETQRLKQLNNILSSCLGSAESAVTSLLAHDTHTCSPSSDLQQHLDQLLTWLKERRELEKLGETTLHQNLCALYQLFSAHWRKVSELETCLQEERTQRAEGDDHTSTDKSLPPSVLLQLETLHKALREKKKACKSLEERLASAQSNMTETSPPSHLVPAMEQDDKCVQVDLQDLGYETSGKSENDREESSSTDLEVRIRPGRSTSSLPSLLKQEHVTFSSTENLDSTSSTPYPSSPALSSAKTPLDSCVTSDAGVVRKCYHSQTEEACLKYTQVYEDCAVSEDSAMVLKTQQENKSSDLSPSRAHLTSSKNPDQDGQQLKSPDKPEKSLSGKQLAQTRSRSTSPARLDSLVQSQARELSQLRQQIKESRRLGDLQRGQLLELSKAFQQLLQASEVDCYIGEVVKGQLDKSMSILDRLEGRLDKGDSHLDSQDMAALELSRSCSDSTVRIQQEIDNLRVELGGDREMMQQDMAFLIQQNQALSECAKEQLDLLAVELQEKNQLIQSLQGQVRGQSPSSHQGSDQYSDGTSSTCRSSPTRHQVLRHSDARVQQEGGGERLQGEKERLQEQLRNKEELNASLRRELDLHRSIMAQSGSCCQEQSQEQTQAPDDARIVCSHTNAPPQSVSADLLAEHLQEIRALRQRLEESISTNDRLREQLEKRLAQLDRDSAPNIFIHGSKDKLSSDMRLLWDQNHSLKEQMQQLSRDKQLEIDKLTHRTSKLDQSRTKCEVLRQEKKLLQQKLHVSLSENTQLKDSLHCSAEELSRLQVELKLQQQQLTDSQRLLQSLRVEVQVLEQMKGDAQRHGESGSAPSSGQLDLSELLSEIRRLRLQLERSIQTNTALRQKLEEQLSRRCININYLLPDEGREVNHHNADIGSCSHDADSSLSSGSGEGLGDAPDRLVPGHRMWADRDGRHVLALIEDFQALRKKISEGRKLSRSMDTQVQGLDQEQLTGVSTSLNSMQQVLGEASRLLKLVWRVELPAARPAGDSSSNNQRDQQLMEISRLKSRLLQQEKMLSGVVKRLRTTNQLKEGMEQVIMDQLSLTHGVLKKARGNLEEVPVSGQ